MLIRSIVALLIVLLILLLNYQLINQSENLPKKDSVSNQSGIVEATKKPKIKPEIDKKANALARLLAALPLEDENLNVLMKEISVKTHYAEFEKGWRNLEEKKLNRMRIWRDNELLSINDFTRNLFYPFSGPDFLNAYLLFPNCENYLLFGLERVGELPKTENLKGNFLNIYLTNIRQALSEIFQRNYFITMKMSGAFNTSVKGILPIFYVFLARTNNQIIKTEKVFIEKNGTAAFFPLADNTKRTNLWGLHIEFIQENSGKTQHLFYFATDLADAAMTYKPELLTFIKSFDQKVAFTKSASYLMHTANFTVMRDFILNNTRISVQDDTGVPYTYFKQKGWQVKLYGKYAPPIRDFNYGYQADLDKLFKSDKNIKAIDFTFGYHWWTDKSSILYFTKK